MGRNNADFQSSALYHGTTHPFTVGDIIEPRSQSLAFATDNPALAHLHAATTVEGLHNDLLDDEGEMSEANQKVADSITPRVFTVEPLENDDTYHEVRNPDDPKRIVEVSSRKGFRVTGTHPKD
jgi:hypothetical protein